MAYANFSNFVIIYNPNSTGAAPKIAAETKASLEKSHKSASIVMYPTEYAGHAEELARKATTKYKKPLIISVSGDGGYHEVINGVMQAQEKKKEKHTAVTVIGAGNANDHYRVVHEQRTILEMLEKKPRLMDLINISITAPDGITEQRYAHSYAGIGITPNVAEELNRNKLNIIREIQIIVRAFATHRPSYIEIDGKKRAVDSLILANISQMAKVLTLTDDNSLHDGKFEVIYLRHGHILGLIRTLLKAAFTRLNNQPKYSAYSFKVTESSLLQIDGEIIKVLKYSQINATVAKDAVKTLL